jgi:hypothetical protein
MGIDVDGLACPLHRPTTCSRQTRGCDFISSVTLSRRVVVGGGTFLGDAPGVDTSRSGDRLDIGGRHLGPWGSCFGKVLSSLVAKPFFEGFTPSLFGGERPPEAVCLAWVEKV